MFGGDKVNKIQKVRKVRNCFNDSKCVKVQMDITWKQYDLLKNALVDYSKNFSNKDMVELLDLVRG